MIRSAQLASLTLLFLFLTAFGFGESPITARQLLNSAEEILTEVSKIRNLAVKHQVEKGVKSRSEIEAFLMERVSEEYPEEEIEREARLLKSLGLIPESLDLYEFMLKLLTEQLAGYYDPYSGTFYIADWVPLEVQKPVMAHELTHALQDQHFDLSEYLDRMKGNDDATLAGSALIEGEGLFVMLEYVLRPWGKSALEIPDIVEANRAQTAMLDAQFEVFAKAPNYLRETLLFPYTYGASFIQHVVREQSWSRVDDIYADLPQSTEQILHPSKYLGARDFPVPVTVEPIRALLPDSWNTVHETVLGEFVIYLLLSEALDAGTAGRGSKGWGGDSVALLQNPAGKEALLMSTVWDSERDASQFQAAIIALAKRRSGNLELMDKPPFDPGWDDATAQGWEDAVHTFTLIARADRVDTIELEK